MANASNSLLIREADLDSDLDAIRSVLTRHLALGSDMDRLDWVYRKNPAGPARVWLLEDAETGGAVGTSAAHPRWMRVDRDRVLAMVLGDFAIDESHRSLGPALRLLQATLEPVKTGQYPFSIDFPSDVMRALYRRLKAHDFGRMRRKVRILRPSSYARRRFPGNVVAGSVFRIGDLLVRARDRVTHSSRGLTVRPLVSNPGPEFDELDSWAPEGVRVRGVRSADYLAWRYCGRSPWPHRIVEARRDARLVGYLVYAEMGENSLEIRELETGGDPDAGVALVSWLVRTGHGRGLDSISAGILEGCRVDQLLSRLGFVSRGEAPGPVVYSSEESAPGGQLPARPEEWWIIGGDRDV